MTTMHHPEHLLDRAAMVAMRLTLGSAKGSVNGPGARKTFDELMLHVPAASEVTYEAATIGGVSGWWCRPEDAVKGAAILYLHGGGYVVGSAQAYQHFVGQIAARTRVTAFVPEYRLAPECPFPAAVEDAQATYEGLVAQGLPKIALAGDSAGSGLIPKGAAVISAWTDLAMTGESMRTRAEADPLSTPSSLAAMARRSPRSSRPTL